MIDWSALWRDNPADAEKQWLEAVRSWVPGSLEGEDLANYQVAMATYLDARQVKPLALDDRGVPDWLPHYLMSQWFRADESRDGAPEVGLAMVQDTAAALNAFPAFTASTRLAGILECDVHPIIGRLLPLPEFMEACLPGDPTRFQIEWRTAPWKSKGQLVFGTCQVIPKRDRALQTGTTRPFWRITLSLPVWMMLDDQERERLVHHEMGHAELLVSEDGLKVTPKVKGHEIEEFAATAGRYGTMGEMQARVIAHAAAHPVTIRMIEAAGWDKGQALLFAPSESAREPLRMAR